MRLLATKWQMTEIEASTSSQLEEARQKEGAVQRLARQLADTRTEARRNAAEWERAKEQVKTTQLTVLY